MELTVIIKQEDNLCLSIHIVAITRQCYLNFHMGIKFREIEDPRNLVPIRNI